MQRCIFTRMHSHTYIVYKCGFTCMCSHTHIVYTNIHIDTTVLLSNQGVSLIIVLTMFTNVIFFVFSGRIVTAADALTKRGSAISAQPEAFSLTSLLSCEYDWSSSLPFSLPPNNVLLFFHGLSDSKCSPPSKEKRLAGRHLS